MELEDIRNKYQCDEGRTFAQWKEWVRKNKPSQAQAHIVKAVAPNGSKYERVIGGYTDAQNTAFDLVSHGYKDVKLYHSVNAGPLKLLRNFSAPLHGAKFKDSVDSADSVDSIRDKYANDASLSQKKDQPVKVTNISIKPSPVGGFEGNVYYSKNGETDLYSPWHIMANGKWGFPFGRSSTRLTQSDKKLIEQKIKKLVSQKGVKVKDSVDAVDEIRQKYQEDKLSITSNGFANGSGVLKKDSRKGLKPFEVAFFVKGKDGKPFKTMRSKMAASLEEAKRWANQESRKYNGVTNVEVKEFKDEADCVEMLKAKYCNDFVMKNDIVHLPNMASYSVEIKINGQPFIPMMTVRDVEGAKKDKIAKQAMEQFKKFYWNNSNSFNRPLDKSKAKLTVGKIQYKPDGRSNWEIMR